MRPALDAKQMKTKDAYLQKTYHISYEFYDMLRVFQDYKCYVCRRPENTFKCAFAVDHNHKTGEVRGLLCSFCNRLLGRFFDDDSRLLAMAQYVVNPPARQLSAVLECKQPFTAPHRVGSAARAKALAKMNGASTPKRRKRAKRKSKQSSNSSKSSTGSSKRPIKI